MTPVVSQKRFLHRFTIRLNWIELVGLAVLTLNVTWGNVLRAQTDDPAAPKASRSTEPNANESNANESDANEIVRAQIKLLNNPSYRVRQTARFVVEHHPVVSLEVIRTEIDKVDTVVGMQLVDLVSGLAMHSDLTISSSAIELLKEIANDATGIGRSALNCLSSIADLQEEKAVEILRQNGAYIGPQNFSINGKEIDSTQQRLSLVIDDQFTGSDEDFKWIRFLKSVQVVYLRGNKITAEAITATSELKHLRGLKLRSCELTREQLMLFSDLLSLEQFGLSYMDVDDTFLPAIEQLPIGDSIRLYGTKITQEGRDRLANNFQGVEVFRGSGGFLGISSSSNSTIVGRVNINSAAAQAGIRMRDRILAINSVEVTTFDELRRELGHHEAGDTIEVSVERVLDVFSPDEIKARRFEVKVKLQEEN